MQPSPFPGMDPYLERLWPMLHIPFNVYASDLLQPQRPPGLYAAVGRRDEHWPGQVDDAGIDGSAESFVRIVTYPRRSALVTIVQFLTPLIERNTAVRLAYTGWRDAWAAAGANTVEIDLLRRGEWALSVPLKTVPAEARSDFHVCVRHAGSDRAAAFYPLPVDRRLPVIGIPLRPGDRDVPLDLQALVDKSYLNGACDLRIDYAAAADPPLTGDAAAWADGLLRAAARRA